MLKVNNKDTRTASDGTFCETIFSESYIWRNSGVFVVNFEHIAYLCFSVSFIDFKQVNVS